MRFFPAWASVAVALVAPSSAAAYCPTVIPGLDLDSAPASGRDRMALVVPDAGPTTSERRARESLLRGEVVNSLHGKLPTGPRVACVSQMSNSQLIGVPEGGVQANDRRYVFVVAAPPGVFVSDSTRIPGLISIADIAHPERLRVREHADPVAYLRALDERIRDNGRARVPAGLLATAIIAALVWARPRAAVLAFGTVALTNLLLGAAGVSEPWAVVPLVALGALAAVPLALLLHGAPAVGLFLASVVVAYLAVLGLEGTWVSLSPLGPSQNGRFYGVSNLLETMLLVPALGAAWLLGRRWGWAPFAAVAAVSLVAVAGSRFGADGGGAFVLAAGFALLAVALAGGGRRAVPAAALAGAAAVAVIAADAVLGPMTHVGESVRAGPGEVLADVADRLVLSWRRATADAAVALAVAGSIVALAGLVVRGPRRPLPLAFAAAIGVSLLVNDSPREVAVGGLVGYLALARGERERPDYTASETGSRS
ncbi:MAG: hypothetical protein ICV64_02315 [Thermoleophilia bacterium]|nr:hypothetical protein [Thermoleophilia bacterium]